MYSKKREIQDFLAANYAPLAIKIDTKGDIIETSIKEEESLFNREQNISRVFPPTFLEIFYPVFDDCKALDKDIRIPTYLKFEKTEVSQYIVTISPFKVSEQEGKNYILVLQPILGDVNIQFFREINKPIEPESELKEFLDELQAANEEINAANEELTALNEELNGYKLRLEHMVEERTEELEKQKTQFQNIINNLPGAVLKYRIDASGKDSVLFISDQVETLWEITKVDALNDVNKIWNLTFEEDLPEMRESIFKSATETTLWEHEWRIKTKSGKVKWLAAKGVPEKKEDGAIEWDTLILDITKNKDAKLEVLAQKALLERTESVAKIGSWEWDMATDKIIWSQEIFNILGLDPANGTPSYGELAAIFTEASFNELNTYVDRAIKQGIPYEVELEAILPNGEIRYCIGRGYARKSVDGGVTHLFGSFQDVTKRKTAELTLQNQKEILERTQGIAQIGSWDWHVAEDKVSWSNELYNIFGLDPTEEPPNFYEEHHILYTEKSLKELKQCVENAIKHKVSFDLNLEAITVNGEIKYCLSKGYPIEDEKGNVTHLFGFLQDISKQKATEIELKKQKKLLEQTESIAQIGSWEWNIAMNEVTWSLEVYNIFGLDQSNEPLPYEEQRKIYTKESFEKLSSSVAKALQDGTPYKLDLEGRAKGGRNIYCVARGYARKNDEGVITDLYGTIQDVTYKKTTELKWKDSQEDYKNIADSIPGVVLKYKLNPDGTDELIYLSKYVEELQEIPQYEAINDVSLVWDRIHPDDLNGFIASVQKSAAELSLWHIEYRIILPDGRVKWAQGRGMPKKVSDGSIVWNTLILDITDKIKKEEELKDINDQLDLSIETAQIGIWHLDVETGKLEWNDTLLEIYGLTRHEFENGLVDWQKQLHPEDAEYANNELGQIMKGKKVADIHFRLIRPNGEIRHILASGVPIIKNNKVVKLIGINLDITQIKLFEGDLINAKDVAQKSEQRAIEKNEELIKANNELDRFVYSVSHDLRSPIASAIGLSKLTMESKNIEEIRHLNNLKIKTLTKLDQFIQDILDYSRNSRLGLTKEVIDFKELIDDILLDYHQTIQEKDVAIELSIEGDEIFNSDKLRINIIFNNLISNAFKFLQDHKEDSQISIKVKIENSVAEIMVIDNGIGIEIERQENIFDMFYRANDRRPGSGIGLYILKECLNRLNGNIEIDSLPNKGTAFKLLIPSL